MSRHVLRLTTNVPYVLGAFTPFVFRTKWTCGEIKYASVFGAGGVRIFTPYGVEYVARPDSEGVFRGKTRVVKQVDSKEGLWDFEGNLLRAKLLRKVEVLQSVSSSKCVLAFRFSLSNCFRTSVVVSTELRNSLPLAIGYVITRTTGSG
jgi:hypothetical protein